VNNNKNPLVSIVAAAVLVVIGVYPILEARLWSAFDQLDEAVVVATLTAVLLIAAGAARLSASFLVTGAWAGILIALSLGLGRNSSGLDVVLQAVLQSKLFIFCALATTAIHFRHASAGLRWLIYISLVGAALNLLWPSAFFEFGLRETYRLEGTLLPRIGGFQLNPNRLGRIMALIPLAGPAVLRCSSKTFAWLMILAFIIVVLTGSRVSLALFVMGVLYRLLMSQPSATLRRWLVGLVGLPILLAIAAIGIAQLRVGSLGGAVTGDAAPVFRMVLVAEGARLAAQNFPFGTGLATFATPFATDAGVYEDTVIGETFFLARGTGLFDSNLASTLGETGVLGLLLTVIAYRLIVDKSIRHLPGLTRLAIAGYATITFCFESFLQNAISAAAFALFIGALANMQAMHYARPVSLYEPKALERPSGREPVS